MGSTPAAHVRVGLRGAEQRERRGARERAQHRRPPEHVRERRGERRGRDAGQQHALPAVKGEQIPRGEAVGSKARALGEIMLPPGQGRCEPLFFLFNAPKWDSGPRSNGLRCV